MSNLQPLNPTPDPRSNRPIGTTSGWTLCTIILVTGVVAFLVMDLWLLHGNNPVLIPAGSFLVLLLMAGVLLGFGQQIRRYKQGKGKITSIFASRIWLLAQAASRTGAILSGISAGILGSYQLAPDTVFLWEQSKYFALVAFSALLFCATGWLVEYWCRVDDDPENEGKETDNTGYLQSRC